MRYALAFLALTAAHVGAAVPAWCPLIDPNSALYKTNCTVMTLPAASGKGLVCEATSTKTLVFNGFCTTSGWQAYRNGADIIVACNGTPAPVGAALLYCAGTTQQCGR